MKVLARIAVVLLPVLLAGLGYFAGSAMARRNATVALAHEVLGSPPPAADAPLTNAQKAFVLYHERLARTRAGSSAAAGRPTTDTEARQTLRAEARTVEDRFRLGAAIVGAWCGLVAAVRIASLSRVPRRTDYEIEHRICFACARCFMHCPRERLRRNKRTDPAA